MTEWKDTRLSQAYSLIDAVLAENPAHGDADAGRLLREAAEAVENADVALERET